MAKPVVDRIEKELQGQARVIRIDALSRKGRGAVMLYGVRALPTVVVLDGCGQTAAAFYGVIPGARVIETVRALPPCQPPGEAGG
ncbi:MAG: hypothetical protein Kow00124_05680 [Anaerolineae bacterium]